MAKKGPKRHLKRLAAPVRWELPRKIHKFTVRPLPGAHPMSESLPLLLIIRDVLKYADNAREAKKIIKMGKVLVDGRVRKEEKLPVGLMDVVSLPEADENYRVLFDRKGRIKLKPTENPDVKLCKIKNKTVIKGGHIQLNLHDGRNIVIKVSDPTKAEEDVYKTGDTLLISIPEQEIKAHIPFEVGKLAYITGGKHVGDFAKIVEIERRGIYPDIVTLENMDGEKFKTVKDYVFVVGDEEPIIKL
ncbi:Ribosomal protein S4E, central domain protein [Methanocaldococcus sp. FS406-22]|jgi:small subunit ribosomal protein S4e|uniref:30S ribosomal protein S4e n=1 Tax=Methanocaldococcus sp. (strain FS406-22) TaxID=644281 RepID=UPI0001BF39D8|nr:30S ribosomal protein S4e [Methanocaldococcus sp. FS406-22]ADC70409.1 Ribosomal protein S4E, central domain protein [Methanocaldococcus sp. FS406-22]